MLNISLVSEPFMVDRRQLSPENTIGRSTAFHQWTSDFLIIRSSLGLFGCTETPSAVSLDGTVGVDSASEKTLQFPDLPTGLFESSFGRYNFS
jgi:hypothetical protein